MYMRFCDITLDQTSTRLLTHAKHTCLMYLLSSPPIYCRMILHIYAFLWYHIASIFNATTTPHSSPLRARARTTAEQKNITNHNTMTSQSKSSHQINADLECNDCWIAGMEHLNKKPTPITEYKLLSFVSTFGAPPSVCLTLWNLTETARTGMRRSTTQIRPLMALFLMKNYPRSRAGAGAFSVYTDTWSYYTSNFVLRCKKGLAVTLSPWWSSLP